MGLLFLSKALAEAFARSVWNSSLHTDRLLAERGPDMPVPVSLWTIAADCRRLHAAQIHDACGIHLSQLLRTRW